LEHSIKLTERKVEKNSKYKWEKNLEV